GWWLEDNARVELYDLHTRRYDVGASLPDSIAQISEGERHTQGANALHLEKQWTDWLFVSGGYLYSKLDGDASFSELTTDGSGTTRSISLNSKSAVSMSSVAIRTLRTTRTNTGLASVCHRGRRSPSIRTTNTASRGAITTMCGMNPLNSPTAKASDIPRLFGRATSR